MTKLVYFAMSANVLFSKSLLQTVWTSIRLLYKELQKENNVNDYENIYCNTVSKEYIYAKQDKAYLGCG